MNDAAEKPWRIEYDEENHVVVSTLWGPMTSQQLMESAHDRIRMGKERGTLHYVLDVSRFVATDRASFEAIFDIVTKSYPEMFVDRETRIACIPSADKDTRWFMEFFQTLCDSRGWVLHAVSDHEAALAWLKGSGTE